MWWRSCPDLMLIAGAHNLPSIDANSERLSWCAFSGLSGGESLQMHCALTSSWQRMVDASGQCEDAAALAVALRQMGMKPPCRFANLQHGTVAIRRIRRAPIGAGIYVALPERHD